MNRIGSLKDLAEITHVLVRKIGLLGTDSLSVMTIDEYMSLPEEKLAYTEVEGLNRERAEAMMETLKAHTKKT
jgi:hypothetical protein